MATAWTRELFGPYCNAWRWTRLGGNGAVVGPKYSSLQQWMGAPHRLVALATLGFAAFYVSLAVPAFIGARPPLTLLFSTFLLGAVLALLSAIDLYHQRLPDILTLPLAFAGLTLSAFHEWQNLVLRIVAAALAYTLMYAIAAGYERLRGKPGLGMGDAKLFAAAGAWLGLLALPSVLLFATGSALCAIVLASAFGRQASLSTRIPLGPFLAFGVWIVWLYGPID